MAKQKTPYFSECCGKLVDRHSDDLKLGYTVIGTIPATGDTYCPRCKRDVTKTGNIRKTPRNEDIDKNGSWEYTMIKTVRSNNCESFFSAST